jgi:hypothetical protein
MIRPQDIKDRQKNALKTAPGDGKRKNLSGKGGGRTFGVQSLR